MNARIKELWDKTTKVNAKLQAGQNSWETEVRFMNTFAEMIVRECAQFVEDKFDFIGEEIIVKEKMLEHFGIKE